MNLVLACFEPAEGCGLQRAVHLMGVIKSGSLLRKKAPAVLPLSLNRPQHQPWGRWTWSTPLREPKNSHDISGEMALFTDDASLNDIEGNVLTPREKIQKYLEYYAGINAEIHFTNCQVSDSTVTCNQTILDDCARAFGLNPYPGTYDFTLSNDKIKTITENRFWDSPEMTQGFEVFDKFTAWFDKNYPDEWAAINASDERFSKRESGALIIKCCLEFRASQ